MYLQQVSMRIIKDYNVANGSDPNDAVNYSQLQAAIGDLAKASTVKAKDAECNCNRKYKRSRR